MLILSALIAVACAGSNEDYDTADDADDRRATPVIDNAVQPTQPPAPPESEPCSHSELGLVGYLECRAAECAEGEVHVWGDDRCEIRAFCFGDRVYVRAINECQPRAVCEAGTYYNPSSNRCTLGNLTWPTPQPFATTAPVPQTPIPTPESSAPSVAPTVEPAPPALPQVTYYRVERNSSEDARCQRLWDEPNAWAVRVHLRYFDEDGAIGHNVPITFNYGRNEQTPTEREMYATRNGNGYEGTVEFVWCVWGDIQTLNFTEIVVTDSDGLSSYPPVDLRFG